jgi:hypothetical protein
LQRAISFFAHFELARRLPAFFWWVLLSGLFTCPVKFRKEHLTGADISLFAFLTFHAYLSQELSEKTIDKYDIIGDKLSF